jgi:hypothetical protein
VYALHLTVRDGPAPSPAATVIAALEFAQPVENFLSDVSLSLGHLPLPAEFA